MKRELNADDKRRIKADPFASKGAIKGKLAKKMKVKGFSSMSNFEKWAKESKYDPKHKRDKNSPAGISQAKDSYYSKAGDSEEVRKGKWWKN